MKDLLTLIVYESICIFIAIMLNPCIKKQMSSKQNMTHFIGKTLHHTNSLKSLPKRNVTKQWKFTEMEVSLTHATRNGFGCFIVLRFSFSTSSYEAMFKLLPPSMIMVHNLPWQKIHIWKMLVWHQCSSLFTFCTTNKHHTTSLWPSIIPS